MSFLDELPEIGNEIDGLRERAPDEAAVRRALGRDPGGLRLADLDALLSPAAAGSLEELAKKSHDVTVARFGKTMHLFAPLYLSNECVNQCTYCGFAVNNAIARHTCSPDEVGAEAEVLACKGFRHLLLVSAEHPRLVSPGYLVECVAAARSHVPSVSLEVQTWSRDVYESLVAAGAEGMVVYQETYDRTVYKTHHLHGPKSDYDARIGALERAGDAGFRRLGLGVLVGLADPRHDLLLLAAHARYLVKHYWRAEVTISLPRLRPAAGFAGPDPGSAMSDGELVQALCALRLFLPDVGLVLSTREHPVLRDGLVRLGVTHMSAGSRTEPGGYLNPERAEEQFAVEDARSPAEVVRSIRSAGYDPVWEDPVPASIL